MTACYDCFNEVIEPTVNLNENDLSLIFGPTNLPNTLLAYNSPQQHAFILSGDRPRMCLRRIIMQQVHIVLSVCARHSLLGETLHDVLLTLLE